MPRKMSPEREREYTELRAYIDFYYTHVRGIDPADPVHPTNVLEQIVAESGRSSALQGLKQAVNDTVEALGHLPNEHIQRLDASLREHGIVAFSEIRRRYASAYKRILKRGSVTTETEYYLVAGVLADLSSGATEDERAQLSEIVARYEQK